MKNSHLLSIIILSIFIAATIHYIEYQLIQPKSGNFCPRDIPCFHDYEKGLKAAKKWRKPIALYFTGWTTGSFRTFEERAFGDEAIYQLLKEEYVLITLFVDMNEQLLQSEQFEYLNHNGEKRRIEKVGEKWQHFQEHCFKRNSQPMFSLLNPYEELLQKKPIG